MASLIARNRLAFGSTRTRNTWIKDTVNFTIVAAHVKFSRSSGSPAPKRYLAYGLRIFCDQAIPGLIPVRSKGADLTIHFAPHGQNSGAERRNHRPWYECYIKDADGKPVLKIWKKGGGTLSIEYSHGLAFHLDSALSTMRVTGARSNDGADVASFLLGPVLGLVLRLRGLTCLHASAVNFGGKALVFAGAEGSGKSTAAAIFAKNGHGVLTDDIVALDHANGAFYVRPGYPALNLLSDSANWLHGSRSSLSPEAEIDKQRIVLGKNSLQFQHEPLPLGAVFILDGAESATNLINLLTAQESLIALATATYANRMLDAKMRAAEFLFLSELANSIPILRLNRRDKGSEFERLYEVVCRAASAL